MNNKVISLNDLYGKPLNKKINRCLKLTENFAPNFEFVDLKYSTLYQSIDGYFYCSAILIFKRKETLDYFLPC